MSFDTNKALAKLDDLLGLPMSEQTMIVLLYVKEILLAGHSEDVEQYKKFKEWLGGYVSNQIHGQNRRIGEIEAKIGTELLKPKVKAKFEKMEQRLARLEKALVEYGFMPEKPVTEEKSVFDDVRFGDVCKCGIEKSLNMCQCKPSKPSEPMAHYSEHGVEIGKPSECISIPRDVAENELHNFYLSKEMIDAIKQSLAKKGF